MDERVGLRVSVLEVASRWGDPARALEEVEAAMASGPATDLVLLPEASLTGYVSPEVDFDLSRFAEPRDGPIARAASDTARRQRVALVVPLVLAEDGCLYNAVMGFDAEGRERFVYRKRHPWFPETWATAGREPAPVVRIGDLAVTVAICFDVHFLEADAAATLDVSDVLLFPSAWVDARGTLLPTLRAVARRHRVVVANANWGPGVVRVPGQGGSCIVDASGEVLASVSTGDLRADALVTARH